MRKEFETIAQYKEQMRAMLDKAEAVKNKERTFGNESRTPCA